MGTIQQLFSNCCTSRNGEQPEELKDLYKGCIISGVFGFMFGGYAQARRSRVHFIDTHNTYVFPSHMQAQVWHLILSTGLMIAIASTALCCCYWLCQRRLLVGMEVGSLCWCLQVLRQFNIIWLSHLESFSICHIGITVYRNKEGVLNVVTGGGNKLYHYCP